RVVAGLARLAGEIGVAVVEWNAVPHRAMVMGIETGQQRCPRRSAGRRLGIVPAKQDTLRGEAVEMRCLDARVTDYREAIGAPLVERDEQNVRSDFRHGALLWRNEHWRKHQSSDRGRTMSAEEKENLIGRTPSPRTRASLAHDL